MKKLSSWILLAALHIPGLHLNTEYYLCVFKELGFVKKAGPNFVITNGLRTGFMFEPVPNKSDQVYIRILPEKNYITAYPNGTLGTQPHRESWEAFQISQTKPNSFIFKTAHNKYLMADLKKYILSTADTPSTWEEFSIHEPNRFLERQAKQIEFIKKHQFSQMPSKLPNIYILILDTMREDFVNPTTGPNLLRFKNESVHTPIALAGATTTHPSVYSLFHARPAYEFYASLKSGYQFGSFPLGVLKYKLGYQIQATGKRDMGCLASKPPKDYYPLSETSYLVSRESRFGFQTHLLDSCQSTGLLGNEAFYVNGRDQLDEYIVEHLISLATNPKKNPKIILAHFEGAHAPYVYGSEDEWVQSHFTRLSEKRYASAFHRTDRLFGQFVAQLKEAGLYDDALIVVLGDHGEIFRDHPFIDGDHGGYPVDNAQARVPLYFKFPNSANYLFKKTNHFSTLSDVFPTIFDYFGLLEPLEDFFTGRSIRNLNRRLIPVMRVNPDNHITFYSSDLKINTVLRESNDFKPANLEVIDTEGNITPTLFENLILESRLPVNLK